MADEKISLELLIEASSSAKTLGDLKSSFTKLNEEIEKVDQGSAEFRKLQSAITKTGSKVKNLELSLESLDKEQVATALGGVTGGIGDITNALVLLGGENENMEQMVNNITTAMAVSMGLKGAIEGASDGYKLFNRFLSANATIMKVVTIASKALKFALIATGIGAIVILLATLVTSLDDVKGGFKKVAEYVLKYFKPQIEAVKWLFKEVVDYVKKEFAPIIAGVIKLLEEFGAKETEVAKKTREANEVILKAYQDKRKALEETQKKQKTLHDATISGMDREISLAKAQGKNTQNLERKRIEQILERSKLEATINKQKLQALADEMRQYIKLGKFKDEEIAEFYKELEERKNATIKSAEDYKNAKNSLAIFDATKITESRTRRLDANKVEQEDLKNQLKELQSIEREAQNNWHNEQVAKIQSDLEEKQRIESEFKQGLKDALADMPESEDEAKEREDEERAARELENFKQLQIDKQIALHKGFENARRGVESLANINSLMLDNDLAKAGNNEAKKEQLRKQSFKRQKTISLALATIDGYKAITAVLAQPLDPITKGFYLASTGTAILAQLAKIKSSTYNSPASSGSSPILSVGDNTSSASQGVGIEPVSNTSTMIGNQKVFVTETDISSTINKVEVIEGQSSF